MFIFKMMNGFCIRMQYKIKIAFKNENKKGLFQTYYFTNA